jgi:hypothetical protein
VDADATAYLSAVQTADGQALEPAVRNAITAFVVGCKQDGIWSAIKASCLLMGARTLSGALTPLVGAAPTNINLVSGDYNRKTGILGDGATKRIATGRLNDSDPQDNNHNAVYISSLGSGGVIGIPTTFTGANSMSAAATRNRNTSASLLTVASAGFYGMSRNASASYAVRTDGSNTTFSVASQTPTSNEISVIGLDATTFGTHRVAFYSIGESLTLSLLDARVTTLYNAIGAAIP